MKTQISKEGTVKCVVRKILYLQKTVKCNVGSRK